MITCAHTCAVRRRLVNMAGRTLTAIVLVVCLADVTCGQELKFRPHSQEQQQSEPLSMLWGIADATAYVGKLFSYTLPNDAFEGNVVRYDVTEVGKTTLPSFLTFNSLKAELKGIPSPKDKGRIYLEVYAIGDDNSRVRDVFSIEVLEDMVGQQQPSQVDPAVTPKPVSCRREQSQTIMTLIVDLDLDLIKPQEKVKLLDNLVGHLNLQHEMLTLLPVGQKPLFDSNALVAGPGNVETPQFSGSLLSWIVGCGSVEKDHMNILQLVEASAKNGDMTSAIGHNIIGWHVTNTRFQERHRKRRAAATATPTMTVPVPTKTSDMTTGQATQTIAATSVVIMPTKTVQVQPTSVVVDPHVPVKTSSISPSSTIKMSKTMDTKPTATASLPDKTYTMTSSSVKTDTPVAPSTTTTTASATTRTTPAPTTKKPSTPEPLCPSGRSKPPMLNKRLPDFQLPAGSIKRTRIPDDTFFDCYSNITQDLTIEIMFKNGSTLPPGFWLQLVRKIFKPYVILTNPLKQHKGRHEMKVVATNIYLKTASFDFVIDVEDTSSGSEAPPNHEMSMTFDTDYDAFMSSLDNRIELSRKISNLFNDRNSNSLTVLRIDRGSVEFAWTNNSVSTSYCPVDDITQMVNTVMNSDGSLTEEAKESMRPYTLSSAASVPLGSCKNNPNFPTRSSRHVKPSTPPPTTMRPKATTPAPTPKPDTVPEGSKKPLTKPPMDETTQSPVASAGAGGGGDSDIWITTVVPAIVVVIVLIIALIIACCLYRKKRKGKMKLDEQNGFGNNKRAPVIFADEYDEKPNESSRPLIMEDEKPPMPPPEYQRASSETSGNSNSTQPIEDRYREEIEMDDTDVTSPLYSPPPPVTASNHSKPPHVQSSRGLPPPYVPP